jgi:hypothetical protein
MGPLKLNDLMLLKQWEEIIEKGSNLVVLLSTYPNQMVRFPGNGIGG